MTRIKLFAGVMLLSMFAFVFTACVPTPELTPESAPAPAPTPAPSQTPSITPAPVPSTTTNNHAISCTHAHTCVTARLGHH